MYSSLICKKSVCDLCFFYSIYHLRRISKALCKKVCNRKSVLKLRYNIFMNEYKKITEFIPCLLQTFRRESCNSLRSISFLFLKMLTTSHRQEFLSHLCRDTQARTSSLGQSHRLAVDCDCDSDLLDHKSAYTDLWHFQKSVMSGANHAKKLQCSDCEMV